MIIEYWFRQFIVNAAVISLNDITEKMVQFGNEYEYFDPLISSKRIEFIDDNLTLQKQAGGVCSAYGFINATPAKLYRWKLELLEDCYSANIGIIEVNSLAKNDGVWDNGIRFYQGGSVHSYRTTDMKYSKSVQKGDIIEMCLDLKDKYTLSYIINNKNFGVTPSGPKRKTQYKLAIGFYQKGKVRLVSWDIN